MVEASAIFACSSLPPPSQDGPVNNNEPSPDHISPPMNSSADGTNSHTDNGPPGTADPTTLSPRVLITVGFSSVISPKNSLGRKIPCASTKPAGRESRAVIRPYTFG